MSKVWICQNKTAGIPLYLTQQQINVYSLEELCYYLYQNAEVIEETFFDEKLLLWLEKELGLASLCEKLRTGLAQGKDGFWCMLVLLWESGYYTREELERIETIITQIVQAKPEERKKLQADRMLQEGRYKGAMWEYLQLLNLSTDKMFESKIWHNMGTAYAKQFLFQRAAQCYKKAYELGDNEESRQQYLLATAYAEGQKLEENRVPFREEQLRQVREQEDIWRYEKEVYLRLEQLVEEYMRSE